MIANILQIGGAAVVAFGLGLWSLPLGLVVAGVFAILFGTLMERK